MKYIKHFSVLIILLSVSLTGFSQLKTPELPGKYKGYTLLPNGWKLTPAGKQIPIGELPLNMVVTKDEHFAITSNSGMGVNSISVVDLSTQKEIQRMIVHNTWLGLTFGKNNKTVYVSGGNDNKILIFHFEKGRLSEAGSIKIGEKYPKEKISLTGLAYWKKKNRLLVVSQKSNTLYVIDVKRKSVIEKISMAGKCYDVVINHAQNLAYVSLWGKSSVVEINLKDFSINQVYTTGDHPNQMVLTRDDSRLFVANANNNSISVLDLKDKKLSETLHTALLPDLPYGSTPNSVALTADNKKLIVANADNNYLAVFDVSAKGHAKNLGFIPVGWYPTSVKVLSGSKRIVVTNGKGIVSRANPNGPNPTKRKAKNWRDNYTGTMLKGSLSIINFPNPKQLGLLSKQVYKNTPYTQKDEMAGIHQHVIPVKYQASGSKKIKHVFYIIRENRSYDQVFGDIAEGNGDSSLCLFGRQITPNAHQLVHDYTLYDNFYVDAEISADGHNWSTAAYATDYVEKLWPVNYGRRGASYDFEGGVPAAAPTSGYIWNNVMNHHKSFRNYGEFLKFQKKDKSGNYIPNDKDLDAVTCRRFSGFNLSISDLTRYKVWEKDFDSLLNNNAVPAFSLMRLPNDHCWGTRPGKLTPQAYVAQNDYALGLLVDKISHSKIWNESIIYVLEDDAQNGPDHVDAHRSVLLVIGPYVKRNFVDHTLYTTSGVLKTMELVLGLPPMTQFDLSANPVLNSMTDSANFSPYAVITPKTDIHKRNSKKAYGAKLSKKLNFSREDAIPDGEYNKILWKAVKGKEAVVPAPVHSAFVRETAAQPDDD